MHAFGPTRVLIDLKLFALIVAALPTFTLTAFGGEYAVLSSGSRIHVDRHEAAGESIKLYSSGGVIELPASAIASFEQDDYVPPPPPVEAAAPIPTPKPARPIDPRATLKAAAARSGLPGAFVESVAKTESGFDPKAVSSKGAIGVMQLMPETARALGADPSDPEQNIDAGTRLLRELLIKYGGDVSKALAAYNAGEKAVDHYHGVPPFSETQHYVNKVVNDYLRAGGTAQ